MMPNEPHQCRSASIPAIAPTGRKTLAQYQAEVAARFGGVMPSWEKLAKRENIARLKANGVSTMSRDQWDKTGHSEEAIAKIVEASKRRGEINMRRAVEALTDMMTVADLIQASGMPKTTVRVALDRALEAGLVVKGRIKNVIVWERRLEAAE